MQCPKRVRLSVPQASVRNFDQNVAYFSDVEDHFVARLFHAMQRKEILRGYLKNTFPVRRLALPLNGEMSVTPSYRNKWGITEY
jgi:hypothetical protein